MNEEFRKSEVSTKEHVLKFIERLAIEVSENQSFFSGMNIQNEEIEKSIIVARSVHQYGYAYPYGDHYRILVAVGGLKSVSGGLLEAVNCFVSLFAKLDLTIMNYDIYSGLFDLDLYAGVENSDVQKNSDHN